MKKANYAFTLIELIVSITIIAILWTIAFISLQWYSKSSRDSVRISDVSKIKTSLELFLMDSNRYPLPDDNQSVVYDTDTLRYQWFFWTNVVSQLSRNLSEVPTDPLTSKRYIFSVSNKKNEFEILALLEWDLAQLTYQTYAANLQVTPRIDWTYNWVFIKSPNYIVPVPSIINTEVNWAQLTLNATNISSQIVSWWDNVPDYWNIVSNTWALSSLNLSVYTWSISPDSSNNDKMEVMNVMQNAYTWSSLVGNHTINLILSKNSLKDLAELANSIVLEDSTIKVLNDWICWSDDWGNLFSEPSNFCIYWASWWLVDNWIWNTFDWYCEWTDWWSNTNCSANHVDWRYIDNSCDLPDVIIWIQQWAWCNSTTWTWFEFWQRDIDIWTSTYGAVIENGFCHDYDWNEDYVCTKWDVTMASDTKANTWFSWTNTHWDQEVANIWWKFYTWDNSASACPTWYHVPSESEWEYAEEYLFDWTENWSGCRTIDGRECDWEWWKNYSTLNLAWKLKIPLSWFRYSDGNTFNQRWFSVYLWSSTEVWWDAYHRYFFWDYSTLSRELTSKTVGHNVRCIKD